MGVTDEQFLVTIIVFLISTLYWLAVDALIRRDEAETEAMRKIHQTTFNQAAVLMIISIIGTLSLVFL
jgi:cytochrome b